MPHFADKTFAQISYLEVRNFIAILKRKKGPQAGTPLSTSRIKNILTPLRKIWRTACKQNQWILFDPFDDINEDIPKIQPRKREGFRFDDAMTLLHYLDPWYRPIVELMLLTGMISSELAALKRSHLKNGQLLVQESIVRDREKQKTKNIYRTRIITITAAISQRLEVLSSRTQGEYLVTTPSGTVFRASNFLSQIWNPAMDESELPHRVPYSLRHTFAAWSLAIGVDKNRLVSLMGHNSKKMIYERYGTYIEGLAEDAWKIREYFGLDFLAPEIKGQGPEWVKWLESMKGEEAGEEQMRLEPEKEKPLTSTTTL